MYNTIIVRPGVNVRHTFIGPEVFPRTYAIIPNRRKPKLIYYNRNEIRTFAAQELVIGARPRPREGTRGRKGRPKDPQPRRW